MSGDRSPGDVSVCRDDRGVFLVFRTDPLPDDEKRARPRSRTVKRDGRVVTTILVSEEKARLLSDLLSAEWNRLWLAG